MKEDAATAGFRVIPIEREMKDTTRSSRLKKYPKSSSPVIGLRWPIAFAEKRPH